ncbi:helix-turn-helix domain-containing protein [Endozoicomonas sp. 4G]|uniref:helix-turn-helix domain-containing protein n=1 Tax=Endozoicomonas sp. 4G TaxID=2872754 RepID=UPI002078DA35|nr:helix-turn-helix domain-containing protein [Endozoicomonas sp. 4G]
MLQGIRLKANPTDQQKLVLSQWMGCARLSLSEHTPTVLYPGLPMLKPSVRLLVLSLTFDLFMNDNKMLTQWLGEIL